VRQTGEVNPLIATTELARELASADPPVLLDVRWSLQEPGGGARAYAAAHLPGATFVDLDRELAGKPGPNGRHPLPSAVDLERTLRAAGVRTGQPVVVYDAGGPQPTGAAARAWWTLRWAGHAEVRVLDGGYAAWVAEGRPVSAESVERPPGDVTVRPGAMPVLDAAAAAELAASGGLLDARVAPRYRGEVEPIDAVAGHIPGALNLPAAATLDPTGRLLDPATLRKLAPDSAAVGAYCGSGVTAAHTVLALTVAGLRPALYVGSWSDWITDPDRPIVTGDQP
jgi:thiosulfate/3-mercaptopyruvate sulfurtransferase